MGCWPRLRPRQAGGVEVTRQCGHHREAAQGPTAGGRCDAFAGHFMVPPTATVLHGAALQKRPPGGRSGAARRRAEARLDSARKRLGTVAEAPARHAKGVPTMDGAPSVRRAVGRSRGGVQARLDSARASCGRRARDAATPPVARGGVRGLPLTLPGVFSPRRSRGVACDG